MRPRSLLTAAGLSALVLTLALASGNDADAGGLLVADGGFGGLLEIKEHTANVSINNGIAVTRVNQVFKNTENRIVEALYIFPVPKGASVADFSMWINGKEMIGEVVEKERARQIYESYKKTRRDPGLLEQKDFKTFEMRVFPIAAGAEQRIRITYYQELDFDHDWATYVYPLATSPRQGLVQRTTGKFALSFEVLSEVPIVKLVSPSHPDDFVMADHNPRYHQASLETTGGDLNRDVVLAYELSRPHTGIDLIASKPEAEDGYFALTITAGKELDRAGQGMDYVFVLDVSGSMAHQGKLRLSRDSIGAFVKALAPEDRFEIITFNVRPTALFNELRPVNETTRKEGDAFLSTRHARGGTHLRPALAASYKYGEPDRTLNVVVLSDGMTEQKERAELINLIRTRPASTRVFCVGIGNEVERPLLRRVAEFAGGFASFVSHGDDFTRLARAFRRKVSRPAATDLNLAFEGVEVYDVEPRELPNLFHGMPIRVYGRYRGGGKLKIDFGVTIEGRDSSQRYDFALPEREGGNSQIERMWAWHRIRSLDKTGGPEAVSEIIRLGEGYSIVTKRTSFLVLENDAEYRRWKIERKNVRRLARDRVTERALVARFKEIRDKADPTIGPNAVRRAPRLVRANNPAAVPQSSVPTSRLPDRPRRSRSPFDRIGGGAFDPLTAGIAACVGVVYVLSRRRRRQRIDS